MMKHTQSYIICATPRSGSTLLCDLLADTGVAGCPDSFFRRQSIPWWAHHFDVSVAEWTDKYEFDQSYLSAVHQYGSGGTPVFGMLLMWETVGDLSRRLGSLYPGFSSDIDRYQSAFGPSVYVHLDRENKVAQAVSRIKAEQTGLWHIAADGTERERLKAGQAAVYNAISLSRQVTELEAHDAAWKSWFVLQGIRPVRITYEALSTEPQFVLRKVLSALGLDPAIASTIEIRTTKMADCESNEWVTRFQTERNDLAYSE